MTVYIYKITHIDTARCYVGKTQNVMGRNCRWVAHVNLSKNGSKTYIHAAMRKYGIDSFRFEVIDVCSAGEGSKRERMWIAKLKSNVKGFGFNLTDGGEGGRQNAEVRKRMSEIAKARPRKKMAAATKEKIRKSKVGILRSQSTIEKISASRRERYPNLSDEWRRKISDSLKKSVQYKLTDIEALMILYSDKGATELSRKYGVSRKTIDRIRRNRNHSLFNPREVQRETQLPLWENLP